MGKQFGVLNSTPDYSSQFSRGVPSPIRHDVELSFSPSTDFRDRAFTEGEESSLLGEYDDPYVLLSDDRGGYSPTRYALPSTEDFNEGSEASGSQPIFHPSAYSPARYADISKRVEEILARYRALPSRIDWNLEDIDDGYRSPFTDEDGDSDLDDEWGMSSVDSSTSAFSSDKESEYSFELDRDDDYVMNEHEAALQGSLGEVLMVEPIKPAPEVKTVRKEKEGMSKLKLVEHGVKYQETRADRAARRAEMRAKAAEDLANHALKQRELISNTSTRVDSHGKPFDYDAATMREDTRYDDLERHEDAYNARLDAHYDGLEKDFVKSNEDLHASVNKLSELFTRIGMIGDQYKALNKDYYAKSNMVSKMFRAEEGSADRLAKVKHIESVKAYVTEHLLSQGLPLTTDALPGSRPRVVAAGQKAKIDSAIQVLHGAILAAAGNISGEYWVRSADNSALHQVLQDLFDVLGFGADQAKAAVEASDKFMSKVAAEVEATPVAAVP